MTDPDFWMAIRQALLMILDAIERRLSINPRTAEIRKERKEAKAARKERVSDETKDGR